MVRVRPHIGARCRVGRDGCLIAPTQRYESRYPERFERYLQTWEAAFSLLLEPSQIQTFTLEHRTMQSKLEKLIEKVVELRDTAHDDELSDELDNAILHLEAASDRLVQMTEEQEDDDPLDDGDYAYDNWKDEQLTG